MSASDHEEDFYFTEVEVTLDTVMQTFADMHTSSPSYQTVHPSTQFRLPPDHDYQRKVFIWQSVLTIDNVFTIFSCI